MRRRSSRIKLAGRRGRRPVFPLDLERLEARQLLAVFTVTNTGDNGGVNPAPNAGTGTLRQAIVDANATSGADTINFNIPGLGVQVIQPESPLPTIMDTVLINGASQGSSTTPLIELDGSLLTGSSANGLVFSQGMGSSANGSTVSGLAINDFKGAGIVITGAGSVSIQGNVIGTDATGMTAKPNGVGISIQASASNTIGGLVDTQRNVISGNTGAGISITGGASSGNSVQGNYIGVTFDGSAALPNADGVVVSGDGVNANSGAHNNTIGGTLIAARNVISANLGVGVKISDSGANNNLVQGNYIGTDAAGTSAIPNNAGVAIVNGAVANTVGGSGGVGRNIISGNNLENVLIDGASNNTVDSNYIGLQADGTAKLPGSPAATAGILIRNGATGNTIGGTAVGGGNIISGIVGAGVWVRGQTGSSGPVSSNNLIEANFVGTNSNGMSAIPNGVGVAISDGATNNSIGGITSGRNVISGNNSNAVILSSFGTTGNVVQSNVIGVASDGSTSMPNGGAGVLVDGASNSTIGGTLTGASNIIAYNLGSGVRVKVGTGNAIRRNSIYRNGQLGIALGTGTTPTPNDPMDPDTGPNNLQNYPTLQSAQSGSGSTVIRGSLDSLPSTTFTIEFFSNTDIDPSGYGQGRTFIGSTSVTTDSSGHAVFVYTTATLVATGQFVSATATDPSGNTSEFAHDVLNVAPKSDLSVSMSVVPTTAVINGLLTYTVAVTNNGPDTANNVTLTDTLPTSSTYISAQSDQGSVISVAGSTITVNVGTLNVGATNTLTLVIVPTVSGTVTNTATAAITSGGIDPDTTNNTATLNTPSTPGVDLALAQVALPAPANAGAEVAFVLTITNNSTTSASNVVLTDTLPSNFTYVSATSTQGTVSQSGGVVTAQLGTLPPSPITGARGTAQVTIVGIPTTTGKLTNAAIVTGDQPQTVVANNVSSLTVAVSSALSSQATSAPQITKVERTGRGYQPTHLVLTFNQALDPTTAQNIGNYTLTTAGRDHRFGTRDDGLIRLQTAVYDATAQTVTLTSVHPYSLHLLTRLTVNGQAPSGVTGANGMLLDGKGNGQAGSNYVAEIKGFQPVAINPQALDALLASGTPLARRRAARRG